MRIFICIVFAGSLTSCETAPPISGSIKYGPVEISYGKDVIPQTQREPEPELPYSPPDKDMMDTIMDLLKLPLTP